METTIQALQQGKVLTDRICDGAIKAASALEQLHSEHKAPWEKDYTPFDFCGDMDALREIILFQSDRFIEVARWSTAHDFRPLDEIAAVKHGEEGLPEHRQSSPLYLLALEMRTPWVIADEANMDIKDHFQPHIMRFLWHLLFLWGTGSRPARLELNSSVTSIIKSIDGILILNDYPFTAFTHGLRSMLQYRQTP